LRAGFYGGKSNFFEADAARAWLRDAGGMGRTRGDMAGVAASCDDWPGKLKVIEWVYGEMLRKLAPGETVRLLVESAPQEALARRVLAAAHADLKAVQFLRWPTNRGWTRDTGPIFVRGRGASANTAIVHFHFNAWAKYPDWPKDRRVPERAAELLGKRLFHARRAGRISCWKGARSTSMGGGLSSRRKSACSIRKLRCEIQV